MSSFLPAPLSSLLLNDPVPSPVAPRALLAQLACLMSLFGFIHFQCLSPGAEGGVCIMEAAVPQQGETRYQWTPDQCLAFPPFPLPSHHVSKSLQPHARVPWWPHLSDAHANCKGYPKSGKFHKVNDIRAKKEQLGHIIVGCVITYECSDGDSCWLALALSKYMGICFHIEITCLKLYWLEGHTNFSSLCYKKVVIGT